MAAAAERHGLSRHRSASEPSRASSASPPPAMAMACRPRAASRRSRPATPCRTRPASRAADDTLRLAVEATTRRSAAGAQLTGGGLGELDRAGRGNISFAQKQQVNRALLRSGAPIGEMNIVRKHLSRIGGRMAGARRPAPPPRSYAGDLGRAATTILRRSPRAPPCRTRPRSRMPGSWSPSTISPSMTRCAARSTIPGTRAASPAILPRARATFELLAKPKASIDAAVKVAQDAGYETIALGAPISKARPARSRPSTARLAPKARSSGPCCVAIVSRRRARAGDRAEETARGGPRPGDSGGGARPPCSRTRPTSRNARRRHRWRRRRRRQRDRPGRRRD